MKCPCELLKIQTTCQKKPRMYNAELLLTIQKPVLYAFAYLTEPVCSCRVLRRSGSEAVKEKEKYNMSFFIVFFDVQWRPSESRARFRKTYPLILMSGS